MYQALTQVDGQSHKRFRVFKKYHNREMNDMKSEMNDMKSEIKNQSESIKSIEQTVSSLADSVKVLMKRFENSSSSSSSDSSDLNFSRGRRARRTHRARGAKHPPIQNVAVNTMPEEVEEEQSSAIRKFHNCSLSLVDSKLVDENPDVVLGNIGCAHSYQINRNGDNICGLTLINTY